MGKKEELIMSAVTRWTEYSIDAAGVAGTGGGTQEGTGTRGYNIATGGVGKDKFNIGVANNKLYVSLDGDSGEIVLASGTALDPRFVARDITEKLHNLTKNNPRYDQAQCVWENGQMRLYSGTLGSSSSATVLSGTNSAHIELGWGSDLPVGGINENPATGSENQYNGGLTVSGTYNGFFDEVYTVVIHNGWTINTPVKGGSNTYTGTITTGGIFNNSADITYTLNIDATSKTMGGGTGNVPVLSWTTPGNVDNSSAGVELLYPNYFYKVGTKGLMVKFSDAVFSDCPAGVPAWTIECLAPLTAQPGNSQGAAGAAMYVWGSSRGDDSGNSPITTSEDTFTRLGSRGLYIKFTGDNMFLAGDQFQVICTPPQPKSYDITNLNYGNVTVYTESPVKAVIFEIMSGAVELSTVKFGLQSHGSFEHHDQNTEDTFFRFGTVGPGQPAGSSPINGLEWHASVIAGDINNDLNPSFLHSTKADLAVVSDADDSESIGSSAFMGMTSDPIFLNIRLGASEVGANSTINYRIFFDYS
jgi:hypothetical protein